jgi:hypothetical protein
MIAAFYTRESTAQEGMADDAKTVTQQVQGARTCIEGKGWTFPDEHVFTDDGISGAEFKKGPGLTRLRTLLGRRAPFRVLVVRDPSRLGRETNETGMVIKELDEAGCEVWSYTEDRCLTPRRRGRRTTACSACVWPGHLHTTGGRRPRLRSVRQAVHGASSCRDLRSSRPARTGPVTVDPKTHSMGITGGYWKIR